jgi:hypothetical protein
LTLIESDEIVEKKGSDYSGLVGSERGESISKLMEKYEERLKEK